MGSRTTRGRSLPEPKRRRQGLLRHPMTDSPRPSLRPGLVLSGHALRLSHRLCRLSYPYPALLRSSRHFPRAHVRFHRCIAHPSLPPPTSPPPRSCLLPLFLFLALGLFFCLRLFVYSLPSVVHLYHRSLYSLSSTAVAVANHCRHRRPRTYSPAIKRIIHASYPLHVNPSALPEDKKHKHTKTHAPWSVRAATEMKGVEGSQSALLVVGVRACRIGGAKQRWSGREARST